ncbi:FixH family protein [Aquabacter spiritensis]|uniref:Nitrogen fixation protein FixH n=1 Tax=Aquabacter spiritensis TaxID=933073 RepID=A0A4V2UY60_9HYPH|nr:FixH family protein [Aquabacter spiritensis]TCT06138.1 nitrogen fixation protein FixH [Aquabacter spiritensis]
MSMLEKGAPRPVTGRVVLFAILAFFGVVVGVNLVMARLAVSTFGGVETASAYKAGLAFRGEEQAAAEQAARHWQVDAQVRGRGDDTRTVALVVRDAAGRPLPGLEVRARLSHPTDARRDAVAQLSEEGGGRYTGILPAAAGQWDLVLDLSQGDSRLFRSRNRVQLD